MYRFSTLIFGVLFTSISLNLNAQGFSVDIDSVEAQSGQNVCVPVRAKGFVDIVLFQYALAWDQQVLSFTGIQNINLAGLSASNFGNFSPGNLFVSWTEPAGMCLTIDDGTILYEVCFLAIGPEGSSSTITTGGDGLPTTAEEAYTCQGQNVWSPSDTGIVVISTSTNTAAPLQNGTNTFQLSPNPTQSSAQAVFHSASAGSTILLVTDATGRTVFEQKTTLKAGENIFEIPACALSAKGLYQVSLKTGQGVSSQMLSVY